MTYDATPIIQAVITLCVVCFTGFFVPYFRTKFGIEKTNDLLLWVDIAVKAAEQLYTSEQGKAKKQYVLTFLSNKGYNIDDKEIDSMIEAAVLEIHDSLYGTGKVKANGNG